MKPEILAPVGSYESLAAAIKAGADSVYFGIGKLNMRSASAANFDIKDLKKIVGICKKAKVKSYLTINTIVYGNEIKKMQKIIDVAKKSGVDAIIAMDMSVLKYCKKIKMPCHMSTQANISNIEAVEFYSQFADVVVLARELSLGQIGNIVKEIRKKNIKGPSGNLIKVEIFIHGALCVSISGKCYMSLALYNKSANRGECLQACRRQYQVKDKETGDELAIDNEHIMSPKDLCTLRFLPEIIKSGASVFKIEGRGRSPDYVFTVVKSYKQAIEDYNKGKLTKKRIQEYENELESVFNRGFWQGGYYLGKKLGEWAGIYGSRATKTKHFIGLVTHYFPRAQIAEIIMQKESLKLGDEILITGKNTGVVKCKVESLYKNEKPVKKVARGDDEVTFPVSSRVRKKDKVYVLKERKDLQ